MPATEESSPLPVKIAGLFLGPLLAILVYYLLPPLSEGLASEMVGLAHPARATAAIAVLMAVWWMTEAIAMEATSLLPLILLPLLAVYPTGIAVGSVVRVKFEKQEFPVRVISLTKDEAEVEALDDSLRLKTFD